MTDSETAQELLATPSLFNAFADGGKIRSLKGYDFPAIWKLLKMGFVEECDNKNNFISFRLSEKGRQIHATITEGQPNAISN